MIEKNGIPVATVSALSHLVESAGASRIVPGIKIPHPLGSPDQGQDVDLQTRMQLVEAALDALSTSVSGATVF